LNNPWKIRNMLYLFWRLFYEQGYKILKNPEICETFKNSNGRLQWLAKQALPLPNIKPTEDR
jgi:hypothetical protein